MHWQSSSTWDIFCTSEGGAGRSVKNKTACSRTQLPGEVTFEMFFLITKHEASTNLVQRSCYADIVQPRHATKLLRLHARDSMFVFYNSVSITGTGGAFFELMLLLMVHRNKMACGHCDQSNYSPDELSGVHLRTIHRLNRFSRASSATFLSKGHGI